MHFIYILATPTPFAKKRSNCQATAQPEVIFSSKKKANKRYINNIKREKGTNRRGSSEQQVSNK